MAKTPQENVKKFDTGLLLDNSPIVSPDYADETEILQYKIKAEGVKNIAVVASFGAGKSSAIETYLQTHRSDKKGKTNNTYTRISLASFNETAYEERDIERSILQQLLYSQPKHKFPNSKIERTSATLKRTTLYLSMIMTLFLASIILFSLQMGKVFLHETKWLSWVLLAIAGITFFMLMWQLIHYRKLQRIKYKDFEIEVKDKAGESVQNSQSLINKFVDEVLYFFETTDVDLVIFEDLDRLADDKSSAIFVKLRELNTIVNNSNQRKRKITFLYAVKDDMIKKQEERAKFFEFILPIMSILNPVAKAVKMQEEHDRMVKKELNIGAAENIDDEKLKQSKYKLDPEFVNAVSTYLPDMRTLKNAFNDYIITRGRIFKDSSEGHLKEENLFALCVYKNLYPYDYAKLEQEAGLIPILMNKKHLIDDEVKASKDKIKELETTLANADKEHLQNFEELKILLKIQLDGKQAVNTSKKLIAYSDITTFQGLDFSTIMHPSYQHYHGYSINVPADFGNSFAERERVIIAKTTAGKEQIAREIEKEKQNIIKYETMSLGELLRKRGVDFHFKAAGEKDTTKAYLSEIKNVAVDLQEENNLKMFNKDSKQLGYLRFLLQNDYLDEKYMEYTASYKSSLLTSADEKFIQKVQQGEPSYSHKIDNPGTVFSQLRTKSFSDPAILNSTVLENLKLLKEQSKKNDKYNALRSLLNQERASEAIITFIQSNDDDRVLEFLKEIIDGKTSICERLITSNLIDAKKLLVIKALIESATDYKSHNANNKITEYINQSLNYEEMLGCADIERVKKFLVQIKAKISELENPQSEITAFIIESNMYAINIDNLKKVLGVVGDTGNFYDENYAFISENEKVKQYIDSHLAEYIEKVFCNEAIPNENEKEATVLALFNSETVGVPPAISIAEKYPFEIELISDHAYELYYCLLAHDHVKPTWGNVINAYTNFGKLTGELKEYIERNIENMEGSFEYKSDGDSDEESDDFCEGLFIELANGEYKDNATISKIAEKIEFQYKLTQAYKGDANLSVLIEKDNIIYSAEDLPVLLVIGDRKLALRQYVKTFIKEVSDDFDDFFEKIDVKGLKELLLDNQIQPTLKQKLITEFGDKITAVGGFEREYYQVIHGDKFSIPITLLMRFKACANLNEAEKLNLAALTSDKDEVSAQPLFREYMENAMEGLGILNKDKKIERPSSTERGLLTLYSQASGRKMVNGRDGSVTIKKENK